ncbi:hypothetical protein B0H17DRAFT_1130342 [Mycena rosella]|uniref:Uncharacterized protein n=1 Tax=Mycena rosella TaxID=1033263 RepID=A0AAD7DQI0_MYCRO|nr:hypothetical protein B0H17DRAFT_1130342 [Mycena rosella]
MGAMRPLAVPVAPLGHCSKCKRSLGGGSEECGGGVGVGVERGRADRGFTATWPQRALDDGAIIDGRRRITGGWAVLGSCRVWRDGTMDSSSLVHELSEKSLVAVADLGHGTVW